jgi:phenylacetic acid degradation operon negative regulatory protein
VQKSVWISPYNFEKQVREFAYKLDIPRCIFQLTVERFSGLNGRELAGSFWDIRGLQDRYQRLIKLYSKQIASFQAAADDVSISRKRFISNLIWDYQSILAQDPQLPDELLPADWSGSSAKQFVDYCRNTFSPNVH